MKKDPVVSIIIPVYNRPDLLRRALQSVERQTFSSLECIIVDDGSTDTTLSIAQEFAKKDARFIVKQNDHGGASKAVNAGLLMASGKYITLLDSDDEYLSEHLALRVNELEKQQKVDILYGGMKILGDEFVPDKYDLTKKISLYDPEVFVGGTFFGKKDVFLKLNGFQDLPYAADSDFMVRAKEKFNAKRIEWPTYIYYRDHEDTISKEVARENISASE